MTDEREWRKSSRIGNGPRKSPIFHFYVISIPTKLVPSSNKLVVRVFTINYIKIVNAFGRDPSSPFSSWKCTFIMSRLHIPLWKHRDRQRELLRLHPYISFGNGNMNWEGMNCRYEKLKIVPHSVECQACSMSRDFSGFKHSQESRLWILMKGYEYIHRN